MSEVLFLLLFAWKIACMIPPHCVWIWFLVKNRGWAELYICCAPLHRGRTCEGYFPNFIRPISYLGFIWDLYVFVKKTKTFIFPFSHGQGTHSAKIVLIARLKIPQVPQNILVQFVCPNLKVWDFWNKKVSLGVRSPCTTWLKMGWSSFWKAFFFFHAHIILKINEFHCFGEQNSESAIWKKLMLLQKRFHPIVGFLIDY